MADEVQKIIRGTIERIYMSFYDENDALIDPTSATLSIYDNTGTPVVDMASATLTDKTPTKESTGLWYFEFKPPVTLALGVVTAWWRGKIDGKEAYEKQVIEIISEPTAGISTAGYCSPSEVRFILKAASPELDYNDENIHEFIKLADSEIDEDLYKMYYPTEFNSTVPRINQMSRWKTAEIILRTVFAANMTPNISDWAENYKTKYEEIRDGALGVGVGYKPLLDSSGTPLSRKGDNQFKTTTTDYHTTFDMEDAEDQLVDPDRLDDEETERN